MGIVSFVDKSAEEDNRQFNAYGIDAFGDDSLPYYARWIRQDIVAAVYLLNRIVLLLTIIAIALVVIAWKAIA